jgi:hypothetical protein
MVSMANMIKAEIDKRYQDLLQFQAAAGPNFSVAYTALM